MLGSSAHDAGPNLMEMTMTVNVNLSTKPYGIKASAIRGAKRAIGDHAIEGVDFKVIEEDGQFFWRLLEAQPKPAIAAKAKKVAAKVSEVVVVPEGADEVIDEAEKPAKKIKAAKPGKTPRSDVMADKIIDLCKRPIGATRAELAELTGWRAAGWNTFFNKLGTSRGLTIEQLKRSVPSGKDGAKTREVAAFHIKA